MKKYLFDKVLVLLLFILIIIATPLLFSRIKAILFICLEVYGGSFYCKRILLFPLDLIQGPITETGSFVCPLHPPYRYELFRNTFCCVWKFKVKNKYLELDNPVSLSQDEISRVVLPPKDQKVQITYYKHSSILCKLKTEDEVDLAIDQLSAIEEDAEKQAESADVQFERQLRKHAWRKHNKKSARQVVVLGLILGTVFIFGINYWERPIPKEKVTSTKAVYQYNEKWGYRGSVKKIFLYFEDLERKEINRSCVTQDLVNKVDEIESGTTIKVWLHPTEDTILQLETSDGMVISYDEVMEKYRIDRIGFTILGVFAYGCAAYAAIMISRNGGRRSKQTVETFDIRSEISRK
ncbi:MAG: hypothetical protein IJM69_04890 [Firmicutes bacterium]|nr:hypothetical protein [Bacillota bacterium]